MAKMTIKNEMTAIKIERGMFQYFLSFDHPKKTKNQIQKITFELFNCKNGHNFTEFQIEENTQKKIELVPKIQKKVRFNDEPKIRIMYAWPFAHEQARKGNWQQVAIDRIRFNNRMTELDKIISPILKKKQMTIV